MRNKPLMQRTRHRAKVLYLSKQYTSTQICEMVGITNATMSKWVKRYGWKNPDEAGIRFNIKAFGIVSPAFSNYLEINNPEIFKTLKKEIVNYIKSSSGSGAKLQSIKKEIIDFFEYPELKGQQFDGITVKQVDTLSLKKAERLLALLKYWDQPAIELTIKKVNP
jgi:hypothetical protein